MGEEAEHANNASSIKIAKNDLTVRIILLLVLDDPKHKLKMRDSRPTTLHLLNQARRVQQKNQLHATSRGIYVATRSPRQLRWARTDYFVFRIY